MPEGPELFRVARRIQRALGRAPLIEARCAFDAVDRRLVGRVGGPPPRVTTLGKALMLVFDDGARVYTHNQLYGRWMFSAPDRRPDTARQLRLVLSTEQRSALLYSASEIEWVEPGATHPFLDRVGLDVLSSDASVETIAQWIGRAGFRRRQLGHLLLDQGFLAGVGNYLRSEILFMACLSPGHRPMDLDDHRLEALAEAVHTLMWRSVETGGITNDPDRAEALKRSGWARRDYRHYVFSRADQACFACDGVIEKVEVSGRRLYRCPRCQPPP
ncbi:endonuclease VIII [Wenzhouxiangella sp. XN79A]|uniref:endonuclease VIII n=1 Tax=Wenzhouxiangella sp. XN79A TaxID=2724193 RepID=UPI00144AB177|nr:endonuclease VIII [Wenzhouxiangella sp. XN79A]NKI35214.1 endonuclease VIII [Wenzhouxiangella sp. XN79A]